MKVLHPAAAATAVLLVMTGCAPSSSGNEGKGAPAANHESSVDLVSVTVDQWREEIGKLRGEIVVADMWATWCIPCIERFPHMVELSERYQQDGVRFVSICLDDPGDEQAVAYARQFLREQNATFANYLIDDNVADSFEKLDLLTIPAVFIYGRDGEIRYRLTADDPNNQFTDRDVEAAIEELLG
jgi:thiol-disulfide isomerase/thioredoxin